MKTVYVVGGNDLSVDRMFLSQGYELWLQARIRREKPDLLCFTGGADVMPQLYGEINEGLSHCDPARDLFEEIVYNQFVIGLRVPAVGICRGGQFLNVMNGGKLIQHLGKTISGDVESRRQLRTDQYENHIVRVDHHQGIVPTSKADPTLLYLPEMGGLNYACFYPDTRCLCFQPHPEWGHEPTRELFFNLIDQYIGG